MKYITALLLALVAITGFAAAMTAPTTSNATEFLATPLNVGVPTTINTPTTVGYTGLLTEGLMAAHIPTGTFTSSTLGGNWEEPGRGAVAAGSPTSPASAIPMVP